MIQMDWKNKNNKNNCMPYVNTILSKSDTSPCPQLIPCRSLYRFIESSLIGQKPELKNLKFNYIHEDIPLVY